MPDEILLCELNSLQSMNEIMMVILLMGSCELTDFYYDSSSWCTCISFVRYVHHVAELSFSCQREGNQCYVHFHVYFLLFQCYGRAGSLEKSIFENWCLAVSMHCSMCVLISTTVSWNANCHNNIVCVLKTVVKISKVSITQHQLIINRTKEL